MNRHPNELLGEQRAVLLKLDEPVVDADEPWGDDFLKRQAVAERLTNLVATQEPPLSISLHGEWGTGKTFLLRRWQRDLENQQFKAIYFNAWEDDFCDDPLLAILGQMSNAFREGKFKTLAQQFISTGLTLLKNNAQSVLFKYTGVTVTLDSEPNGRNLLEEYLNDRASKDELKKGLEKLSEAVFEGTQHPLVFIIDELDRCRPTFAIELLERVKHIFDVPHMVFVFGINRNELCKSLSSIYGEINTEVYLRRFFDFDFQLQEVNSQAFVAHLFDRFQLEEAFQSLDREPRNATSRWGDPNFRHKYDFENLRSVIPSLWSALGLSFRDMDYGIRLLALMVRNIRPGELSHPYLLAVMVALKFKQQKFYFQLRDRAFGIGEIMDYLESAVRSAPMYENISSVLDRFEGFLYCAQDTTNVGPERGRNALAELRQVANSTSGTHGSQFSVISQRSQNADRYQIAQIERAVLDGRLMGLDQRSLGRLAALIDTYQSEVRS